jgi:hypothetical protein
MTEFDRLIRTLELALKFSNRVLPEPFGSLQTVSRALAWRGVQFATASLLGPPKFISDAEVAYRLNDALRRFVDDGA